MQYIYENIIKLSDIIEQCNINKILLVCGKSFDNLSIKAFFDATAINYTRFDDFKPNPTYENVMAGLNVFCAGKYDAIIAIGGGSAIDVAKSIKYYALEMKLPPSCDIPIIAIPTTAGTGSESTQFAVMYKNGIKQSIHSHNIIPKIVILEPSTLSSLPIYQKKCTYLDALCQAVESYWSVKSTIESQDFATKAIKILLENFDKYLLSQDEKVNQQVMLASNLAGRAINISQTTAPHAMSYGITTMFGLPHGHAVAIALPKVWKFMMDNISLCSDLRGFDYLSKQFNNLSNMFGYDSVYKAIDYFEMLLAKIEIEPPIPATPQQIKLLVNSINAQRLGNNPIPLSEESLEFLYLEMLVQTKTKESLK